MLARRNSKYGTILLRFPVADYVQTDLFSNDTLRECICSAQLAIFGSMRVSYKDSYLHSVVTLDGFGNGIMYYIPARFGEKIFFRISVSMKVNI